MNFTKNHKFAKLTRRGLSFLLAVVITMGYILPSGARATDTEEPSAEPTVDATVPETTVPETSEPVATEETKATEPESTTAPTEETVPETTVPEETTAPTETQPEPTAYDKVMADLTALEEEAKTLEVEVEVLDEFTARLRDVWNIAYDLNDAGEISDEELEAIDAEGYEILAFLKDEYGYENGVINTLATAAARDDDITTDNANGAIKFWLFNYDRNINYTARDRATRRPISTYFTFRDTRNADYGPLSPSTPGYDVDGFPKDHATVERVLTDGYPVLDLTRYANGDREDGTALTNVGANVRSLAYLFKAGDHAVTAYTPSNSILQKVGTNYKYDSAYNAVDFDTDNQVFRVRNYLERTQTTSGYISGDNKVYSDFMPFVYTNGVSIGKTTVTGADGTSTEIPYHINNNYSGSDVEVPVDYWFGMVMEVDFYMPKDGKVDGQDMTFKFSGDDDVWVFIDDVLVLDLGGTHGTVDGSINFATGEIKQYLSWNDGTENSKTTSFPTTLRECYTAANKEPRADAYGNSWDETNETFADYTKHTLKFFYLERGAAVANCKLDFNLTTLPDGGASVLKKLTNDSVVTEVTKEDTYTFQLLKQNGSEWEPVSNKAYSVDGVNAGSTNDNGEFSIAQNQMAVFGSLETSDQGIRYRVQELFDSNSDLSSLEYTGNKVQSMWSVSNEDGYVEFTVLPDDQNNNVSHMTTFTNELKTTDFTVTKKVTGNMGDWSKKFAFTAELYTKQDGTKISFPAPEDNETYYTVDDEGVAHFTLHHDQTLVFDDIPLGAYVVVEEAPASPYTTSVALDSGTDFTDDNIVSFVTDLEPSNHTVTFKNRNEAKIDTGVVLESLPYVLILGGVAVVAMIMILRRKKRYED